MVPLKPMPPNIHRQGVIRSRAALSYKEVKFLSSSFRLFVFSLGFSARPRNAWTPRVMMRLAKPCSTWLRWHENSGRSASRLECFGILRYFDVGETFDPLTSLLTICEDGAIELEGGELKFEPTTQYVENVLELEFFNWDWALWGWTQTHNFRKMSSSMRRSSPTISLRTGWINTTSLFFSVCHLGTLWGVHAFGESSSSTRDQRHVAGDQSFTKASTTQGPRLKHSLDALNCLMKPLKVCIQSHLFPSWCCRNLGLKPSWSCWRHWTSTFGWQ